MQYVDFISSLGELSSDEILLGLYKHSSEENKDKLHRFNPTLIMISVEKSIMRLHFSLIISLGAHMALLLFSI